jgi:hypothetical protein
MIGPTSAVTAVRGCTRRRPARQRARRATRRAIGAWRGLPTDAPTSVTSLRQSGVTASRSVSSSLGQCGPARALVRRARHQMMPCGARRGSLSPGGRAVGCQLCPQVGSCRSTGVSARKGLTRCDGSGAEGGGLEPPRACARRFSRPLPYQLGLPLQALSGPSDRLGPPRSPRKGVWPRLLPPFRAQARFIDPGLLRPIIRSACICYRLLAVALALWWATRTALGLCPYDRRPSQRGVGARAPHLYGARDRLRFRRQVSFGMSHRAHPS